MDSVFEVRPEVLSGDTADVYFLRTRAVLEKEHINPVVTMEIFPGRPGLLCGLKEVMVLLRRALRVEAQVWAMDEGEPIAAKQVALRITAPYQSLGVYETAIGLGSYISGASPIDFSGDLTEIDGKPISKRGRIPGITANPRLKRVELA